MSASIITIPIDNTNGVVNEAKVLATWPMTPDQWDRMMLVLEVMRPGLVVDPVETFIEFLSTALVS